MNYQAVPFTGEHVEAARTLAQSQYERERNYVPALPPGEFFPDLTPFAQNGLGTALLEEGGALAGFLCCYPPVPEYFGRVKGVFCPVHAHGAQGGDRALIYSLLYQAASARWVEAGILGHGAGLYAHDGEAIRSFFRNGFGARTSDAIRETSPLADRPQTEGKALPQIEDLTFRPLGPADVEDLLPLVRALNLYMQSPPLFFPPSPSAAPEDILRQMGEWENQFLGAFHRGRLISYLRFRPGGEAFAADHPSVLNICGAYTLRPSRGSGASTALLDYAMAWLRDQGFPRCGVDYETLNPSGSRFWERHFAPYTLGLTRRIDERREDLGDAVPKPL